MSTYQADQANLAWQVSRACDGGQCIGVARWGDTVLIGNTSNPQAPVSEFTVSEWQQFLTGVKLGDFDEIALRSSKSVSGKGRRGASALTFQRQCAGRIMPIRSS